MWVAHVFDGRPLTRDLRSVVPRGRGRISSGADAPSKPGRVFRAKVDSPNKIIQAKVWYVYNDDPPYWRDLVWYPEFMIDTGGGVYEGYVSGKLPDAWLVEVKDIAMGAPGYLTSLPQDITGLPTATRTSRGSRSRLWEPKKKKD